MSSVEDRIALDSTTAERVRGVGLIGDIGATNARFSLVQPGGAASPAHVYALNDYQSLPDAIEAYLREEKPAEKPVQAVLAVASPVTGDQVALTNHPWTFSVKALRAQLGLRRLQVVNDFAANAVAVPHLGADDVLKVGGGVPIKDAPIGVIGPGTGLGVSAFVPSASGGAMIAGEGGHVTMAPATAQESALLDLMRSRFDHVSAERVLSGPGLVNLYNAMCELVGLAGRFILGRPDHQRGRLERRSAHARCDRLVLRHARHRRRQSGAHDRRARRHLHFRRYRAAPQAPFSPNPNSAPASKPRAGLIRTWRRSRPM